MAKAKKIVESDIATDIDFNQEGFDPKNRKVSLLVIDNGFQVEKENCPHFTLEFDSDSYNEAELYFTHLVDCSQN